MSTETITLTPVTPQVLRKDGQLYLESHLTLWYSPTETLVAIQEGDNRPTLLSDKPGRLALFRIDGIPTHLQGCCWLVPAPRPCNCGSEEPAIECAANSMWCG
jgi:hypothetical protein